MGYASYLVWKQGGIEAQKRPLTFYGLQLVANLCWPITFFLRKKLGQAQIVNLGKIAVQYATTQLHSPDTLTTKFIVLGGNMCS